MQNLFFLIKTWLTRGSENQSFIGARWLTTLVRYTPRRWRRPLALRILAWSPHYFYRDIDHSYDALSTSEFLESEYQRNKDSRKRIRDEILNPYLKPNIEVLDYGCGPGFLAKAVAGEVNRVVAVDVSRGVLACAETINSSANLSYLHTSEIDDLKANSFNLIYSFAVIQHVTDEVFLEILNNAFRLLKPEGELVLHIVLDAEGWRNQESWKSDKSLTGRVKLSYGLNCFSRDAKTVGAQLSQSGFHSCSIQAISELCPDHFDDICDQHLIVARKTTKSEAIDSAE